MNVTGMQQNGSSENYRRAYICSLVDGLITSRRGGGGAYNQRGLQAALYSNFLCHNSRLNSGPKKLGLTLDEVSYNFVA